MALAAGLGLDLDLEVESPKSRRKGGNKKIKQI